ncbi:hypothetical protein OpiT1DRAFT_01730 [Opitutaceae bacterium TAV1]|nr:hypothetical protein OpiT1DRAFT_01730 [Opitutaceae bacterium TAV1]
MSNTPAPLTPFQQRAQLRLQEKETEWRRTLFERFRHICREEMMEVMKSLLETMQTPQDLERRLGELRHAEEATREQTHALLTQACEEMKSLAHRLEARPATPATVDTAALEKAAKEATERQEQLASQTMSQQERVGRLIRDDVEKTTRSTKKAVIRAAMLIALAGLAAIAGLKFLGGMTLLGPAEREAQQETLQRIAEQQTLLRTLETQKTAAEEKLGELVVRQKDLEAQLLRTAEAQTAAMTVLSAANREIGQAQQLQEQFRFKLARGETGGVFVEIEPDTKPFEYDGKTYILVK